MTPPYVLLQNSFEKIFVDENGVIRLQKFCSGFGDYTDDGLESLFLEQKCRYRGSVIERDVLRKYIDKPVEELRKYIKKRREIQVKREESPTQREMLNDHREKFGDMIIGVDKRGIDVFPTGVRISLLFNTGYSCREQSDYLKRNFKKCSAYVVDQASNSKRLKGNSILRFCDLSEVTMTRRNEAIFLFEIKDEIMSVLES